MSEEFSQENWSFEPLTNDGMFHLVFINNKKALRSLVSALINVPESELGDTEVLNPMQFSDAYNAKLTVLDLRGHLNNNTLLNIELQVRRFQGWTNRTVVYTCRQITEQSNREEF
ncbi:MAG: PD-(D/E)XK nuclease family transposase, partial [Clostridia bacterium]|nr:PD-(D/E)XK nuclease family transposase [Clostridia bacterium]